MRYLLTAAFMLAPCAFGQGFSFDGFYRGDEGDVFNKEPNSFLVRMTADLKPGKALDVGMGQGRNAIYLASKGWTVTGFDPSPVGVEIARKEASARRLPLTAIVTTSEKFEWGKDQWDLIVFTYVGMRHLTNKIFDALRPGGMVLIESFHADTNFMRVLGPERWSDNELLTLLSRFRVIQYEDKMDRQDWGTQYGAQNRLVRILCQKPAPPRTNCEYDGQTHPIGGKAGRQGEVAMICTATGWQFIR
jgi:SAM-dependent methyltransferase